MTLSDRLNNLLTQYVDLLNEGKKPDPNIFLSHCPPEGRDELQSLIQSSKLIRDAFIPQDVVEKSLQATLKIIAGIPKHSRNIEPIYPKAVNYRKNGELTPEEEQKAQDAVDEIWRQIEEKEKK